MHNEQADTVQGQHRRFMDPQTMTDPQNHATQGALLEVFQMLSDKIEASHKSLRASLEEFSTRIESRLAAHDKEDRAVADRVLRIETLREAEQAEQAREKARVLEEVNRRIATISILVGILGVIVGHFWK